MNDQNNAAAGNKDYLDKALDAAEKKFGGKAGSNPDKYRKYNEKVTDGARGWFEKLTGKKVPSKFSN